MSFEALFQAETLRSQQEAERRRWGHLAELRAARPAGGGAPSHGLRGWSSLHLPPLHLRHRHALPAPGGARLAA